MRKTNERFENKKTRFHKPERKKRYSNYYNDSTLKCRHSKLAWHVIADVALDVELKYKILNTI